MNQAIPDHEFRRCKNVVDISCENPRKLPRRVYRHVPCGGSVLPIGRLGYIPYFTLQPYGSDVVALTGLPAASSASTCGMYCVALARSS